jgi:hypothetical protein
MQITEILDSARRAPASPTKHHSLIAACLAHALHDGYTDGLYPFLPVWQAQFGLSYAGLERYPSGRNRIRDSLRSWKCDSRCWLGMEASMDGTTVFAGFAGASC